ncbi:hypothetical protein FRC17_001378 [Serendipita sp. 399]|nr:hypothetical protein FRC17_001378 [Serendipita sp. 399]
MEHGRLKALFNAEENDSTKLTLFRMQRKPVDESKVVAFTQATAKKSKKQKEEEAAEEKRRQQELEFSQVFEEYVADFSVAPRAKGTIGFVKAGETPKGPINRVSAAFDDDAEKVKASVDSWYMLAKANKFRHPKWCLQTRNPKANVRWTLF